MLILVRHGEAHANAQGLLLGRTDSPLSDKGRVQVAALSRRLANLRPVRIVTSPLRRAVDTAQSLGLEAPVEIDERWIEIDYGSFEGQKLGDVPAEVWRKWRKDPDFLPPGGESLGQLGVRVRSACEDLLHHGALDRDVIVVSHVSPIKAAVAWCLNTGDDLAWRLHLATGSITTIGRGHGGPILHSYNEVPDMNSATTPASFSPASS